MGTKYILKGKAEMLLGIFFLTTAGNNVSQAQTIRLHYAASDTIDALTLKDLSGNGFDGVLGNGAVIADYKSETAIKLGLRKGFVNLGESFGKEVAKMGDFTVAIRAFLPKVGNTLSSGGNYLWTFANSLNQEADKSGYMGLSAADMSYRISPSGTDAEQKVGDGSPFITNAYRWVVVTKKKDIVRIYQDGELLSIGRTETSPTDLGATTCNFIGSSPFAADKALTYAYVTEFKVLDGAISSDEVYQMTYGDVTRPACELKEQFNFETADGAVTGAKGSLQNGASFTQIGGLPVLQLGEADGYFDLGAETGKLLNQLDTFSICTNVYIPSEVNLKQNGNFIFTFSNSSSSGYIFLRANDCRYAITPSNYNQESEITAKTPFATGTWRNLVYMQGRDADGKMVGSIFIDGVRVASAEINRSPNQLNELVNNYLGRSCYSGDVYLKGACYNDFRIYAGKVNDDVMADMMAHIETLNTVVYEQQIQTTLQNLKLPTEVNDDMVLPETGVEGVKVEWASSDPQHLSAQGVVTRPSASKGDVNVTLTATLTKNGVSQQAVFPITVKAFMGDEDAVQFDLDHIALKGNLHNLRSDLSLPSATAEGSVLLWKSSDASLITDNGKLLKLSDKGKTSVTLTATALKGTVKKMRTFEIEVAEKEPYTHYLFTYFPSNSDENIYYALSTDGYNFTPLNNGTRVLGSDSIALKKAVRDPHILRGQDGKTFYMVATDMRCAEGWSSNRGMVLMKSTDMIHWQHSAIHFPDRFPEWKNVTRVWAPETIWDPNYVNTDGSKGRYMCYFSLLTNDGKCTYDKDYYCYVNDDFTDFITEPTYLYDRGSATIDANIVYNEADSLYYMFYKNEGSGGICQVTAKTLTAPEGAPLGSQWSEPSGTLQQTTVAVEGVGVFRKINSDDYIMMYDCYSSGYYQFCSSSDLRNFKLVAQTNTSGAFTPRHGTVMPITEAETQALLKAFPVDNLPCLLRGAHNQAVRQEYVDFNQTAGTLLLPVVWGTDLAHFDPQLFALPGDVITPTGEQDFTAGPVTYTVSSNGGEKEYKVSAEVRTNPIIPGFHADPEVLYSHKTGRFYIYPTTDGLSGWGGHTFDVYSSANLVDWQLENTILDLATDDVPWATGNAWAPCIEEKKTEDGYKYYFYFSGHNAALNYKTLGMAVSNSPVGPFRAGKEPIISSSTISGQLIDSDIFTDPVSGDTYYYWGNGNMVASKMNDDMASVTGIKRVTPDGGSLSDYAYREAPYVFYRNGIYYFLWSVDDTGSANYHVAYGTSTSPMGPIKVAAEPIVLIQDAANEIYGTAHNSVLNVPGTDDWYIVYHRINKKYINNAPGVHREVCIDRLQFNEDGTIRRVKPTHKGVDPVDMSNYIEQYATGIHQADAPAEGGAAVARTSYYTLDGVALGEAEPTRAGIYVKVQILENGRVLSTKISK